MTRRSLPDCRAIQLRLPQSPQSLRGRTFFHKKRQAPANQNSACCTPQTARRLISCASASRNSLSTIVDIAGAFPRAFLNREKRESSYCPHAKGSSSGCAHRYAALREGPPRAPKAMVAAPVRAPGPCVIGNSAADHAGLVRRKSPMSVPGTYEPSTTAARMSGFVG